MIEEVRRRACIGRELYSDLSGSESIEMVWSRGEHG